MNQAEAPRDELPSPKKEGGKTVRYLIYLVVTTVLIGLSGIVLYLLSDINRRQYRLASIQGGLVVEQGRFLPSGFEPFKPLDQTLLNIYAPVPIPDGSHVITSEIFHDRTDLDRAIFSYLSGWIREGLDSGKSSNLQTINTYIERSSLLPGVSEEQRKELKVLRADVTFKSGLETLHNIANRLNQALEQFALAIKLGTTHRQAAEHWIAEIKHRIKAYQSSQSPQKAQNPKSLHIKQAPSKAAKVQSPPIKESPPKKRELVSKETTEPLSPAKAVSPEQSVERLKSQPNGDY